MALGVVTFLSFRARFNLATVAFLYLTVIVILSLQGSFVSSAIVSLLGVMGLAYFFAPPIFSFRVDDPFNVVAIVAFLVVSAVITRFVSKLRIRAQQLEDQIVERKRAEDALLNTRGELERVTRVTSLGQLTASIAHEINQPLAAVVINAKACVRWLARDAPDLKEARAASQRSVENATHASEIINRIRLLFKKGTPTTRAGGCERNHSGHHHPRERRARPTLHLGPDATRDRSSPDHGRPRAIAAAPDEPDGQRH